MKNTIRFLTGLFLLLAAGLSNAQSLAIKAGKVIDPSTGRVSENQVILVENGKIRAIGTGLAVPEGAEVIDLTASVVMPGLIDAHTHLCASTSKYADFLGLEFLDMVLMNSPGYRGIQGAVHAREMLEAGFTTVREAGNAGRYVDVDVKRAISEGLIPGPAIVAAGRIISPFGGQFRARADKAFLENDEYFFADTRDELKKAIRENLYYGADGIKIVVDSKKYTYSADDIRFIVEEARQAGVSVMAHCQTAEGVRRAVEGGVASVEHAWNLPDSLILRMKQKGIFLVSTDFPVRLLTAFGSSEENARAFHERLIKRLKRAYEAGVDIAFGSDVMVDIKGETRGTLAISYLDSFVEAGIPAPAILRILTVNPARLLGMETSRGTLAPGMECDLIATDGNPLEDIMTLKKVRLVMRHGVVY